MSLCHDERDFAMGFSRHDPHAPRHPTPRETRRAKEREEYLSNLAPEQKDAYERVQLCLQAVGRHLNAKGEMTMITLLSLHEHFPAFAERMGFRGPLYEKADGICPAVSTSYPTDAGSFWFLIPYLIYDQMSESDREKLLTREATGAGLALCKEWLPQWRWEESI
jgi:hypothetical protein